MKGMLGVLALLAIGPSVRDYIASPPVSVEPGNGRGGRSTIVGLTREQLTRRAARKAVIRQKRMLRAKGR